MILEGEGLPAVYGPSEAQVRDLVTNLVRSTPSFASLTNEAGDYVQAAGNRPWCVIEHRQLDPLLHQRAFRLTASLKYRDGAKLHTGAGDIILQHDEWFLLKDDADLFIAFLRGQAFPSQVQWRSMNEMLGV